MKHDIVDLLNKKKSSDSSSNDSSSNDISVRRKWKKFGKCAGLLAGPEPGITEISKEEIFIETFDNFFKKLDQSNRETEDSFIERMNSRKFDENDKHDQMVREVFSIVDEIEAVYKKEMEEFEMSLRSESDKRVNEKTKEIDERMKEEMKNLKYVPPQRESNTKCTVKINGFTDEVDEYEVKAIFETYGKIRRMNILKDHRSGAVKGLGFVTYYEPENAQKALGNLKDYRYNNAIWIVELAKDKI